MGGGIEGHVFHVVPDEADSAATQLVTLGKGHVVHAETATFISDLNHTFIVPGRHGNPHATARVAVVAVAHRVNQSLFEAKADAGHLLTKDPIPFKQGDHRTIEGGCHGLEGARKLLAEKGRTHNDERTPLTKLARLAALGANTPDGSEKRPHSSDLKSSTEVGGTPTAARDNNAARRVGPPG